MLTATFDVTRLNVVMNRYVTELGMCAKQVTVWRAGQVVKEIVTDLPPKNLEKSKSIAAWQVRKNFYDLKKGSFRFNGSPKKAGNGLTEWLYMDKGQKYLVGTHRTNLQPGLKGAALLKRMFVEKKLKGKGRRWLNVGNRGRRSVWLIDKPIITTAEKQRLVEYTQKSFGKLKASFAVGWDWLKIRGVKPRWIFQHVRSGKARGRIIPNIQGNRPSVTIISNATGCESEQALHLIRGALISQAEKMKADIRHYATGLKKVDRLRELLTRFNQN